WESRTVDVVFAEKIADDIRGLLMPAPPEGQPRSIFRYLPIMIGGVLFIGGASLFGYAVSLQNKLANGTPEVDTDERALAFASRGRSIETTSYLFLGAGLALVLGGVAFAFLAPEADVTVGMGVIGGGPVVGLSGRLP
ncbi:MAG: hypothetical protein JNK82_45975, partial [Myxococcaceae bacterium]|nr:hypothetical protein [Myxococcaceae bacterium]